MGWRITLALYLLIAVVYGGCIEATALNSDYMGRIAYTIILSLLWPVIALVSLFSPFMR